jgi:catechol 2,3-dioxygenase-like lactoylglutathione lyase family enzyme
MIDHFFLPVTDLERSRVFYRLLLGTLGTEESFARSESVGFGVGSPGAFWIYAATGRGEAEDPCGRSPETTMPLPHLHVSFRAETRQQVKDFSAAAERISAELVHGPQLFEQYHPTYFAAFVRDPDGHNIEAVCHAPS